MSDKKKVTEKSKLTLEQTAEYLRKLASKMEKGQVGFSEKEIALDGEVQVKQSLKSKSGKGSMTVKLKVGLPQGEPGALSEESEVARPQGEAGDAEAADHASAAPDAQAPAKAEPEPEEKPSSYKKLKKLMGAQFKGIAKGLEQGSAPDLETAKSFYENCLEMTTHSGKGDEFYPDFKAEADEFWAAAQSGDLGAVRAACEKLAARKKACHKEHK